MHYKIRKRRLTKKYVINGIFFIEHQIRKTCKSQEMLHRWTDHKGNSQQREMYQNYQNINVIYEVKEFKEKYVGHQDRLEKQISKRRQTKVQKFCIFANKNRRRETKVGQTWSLSKSGSSFPKGCTVPTTLLRHSEFEVPVQYPTRNIIAGNQKCRITQWQKTLRRKYIFGHCTN